MKTLLLLPLTLLCSCSSIVATHVGMRVLMSSGYDNPARPEYKYKAGDKMILKSPIDYRECDVLYATSNPYSENPMMAKYEVKCPTENDTRTITDEDLKRYEERNAIHEKELLAKTKQE